MGINSILDYNPVWLALFATLFTLIGTTLGASMVWFFKSINRKILNAILGFAAGVMIAASFFSLLKPSIEMAESLGFIKWVPAVIGFIAGAFFLYMVDKTLPHLHMGLHEDQAEGIKTKWQRSVLLILAITLHNIPEGLAVGVAFGALSFDPASATLSGAMTLALGIALQNIPEGAAVSVSLRREEFSRARAFFWGVFSGVVEPIFGVLGALMIFWIKPVLPFALSFAAGAMIFVVVEELIPESQAGDSTDLSTIGALVGFAFMMFLDLALG